MRTLENGRVGSKRSLMGLGEAEEVSGTRRREWRLMKWYKVTEEVRLKCAGV